MVDEFSINNRIQQIMHEKNLTNSAFADKIGVQRSSISQLFSGRNKPSIDFILKILKTFKDIDANWLLNGSVKTEGKMETLDLFSEIEQKSETIEPQKEYTNQITTDTQKTPSTEKTPSRKEIEKIVIFYTDKTFSESYPE